VAQAVLLELALRLTRLSLLRLEHPVEHQGPDGLDRAPRLHPAEPTGAPAIAAEKIGVGVGGPELAVRDALQLDADLRVDRRRHRSDRKQRGDTYRYAPHGRIDTSMRCDASMA